MQHMLLDLVKVVQSEIVKKKESAETSQHIVALQSLLLKAEERIEALSSRVSVLESANNTLTKTLHEYERNFHEYGMKVNSTLVGQDTTNAQVSETLKSQQEQLKTLHKQMKSSLDCHLRGREALNSLSAATKRLVMREDKELGEV